MASTYVNNLRLEEITTGEKSGTWGSITNTNLELVGEALGYGTENMGSDANTTITVADGAADAARSFYLKITSTSLSADRTVTLAPNTVSKVWIIENATTNGKTITIKQGTGATIDIPNGDVKVVATDGAGAGGAVYDLLVDLNIATKLTVKNPATSSSPATVLLQSGDTDVAADDVLGKIQFQAPDEGTGTDALLVAGEIAAISEGDFSSSSNATKLSFKTGASEAATEKMSISSVGNITMKQTATGDDTPMTLLLQTGETDIAADDKLGVINFQAPDEGTGTDAILVAAGIEAVSEGDFSSSSNATKLSFKTASSEAAAEKMAISSVGNVTMKQTATGDDTPMTLLLQTGETDIAADDVLGKIQFQAPDEGTGTDAVLVAAEVAAISEGDFSSSSNATSLSFKTGSSEAATEKVRITSNGGLLANTPAATAASVVHELRTPTAYDDGKWTLKLMGTSTNTDGTGPYGLFVNYPNATPDNNSTNDFFFASDATAGRFIIISSGDFWSADGGWVDSDETLKENIVDASNKLADVEKLKVRNFNWKESHHPSRADKKLIGFVAQEMEAVFPGLVDEHDINPQGRDGTPNLKKGVKTTALIPILTKALQELSAKVTALEARVTTLEG